MIVNIEDETNDTVNMSIEREMMELYPWVVLNINEIGIAIAYQLFDAEYQLNQEYLDEEINDYLSGIHERILEKAIDVLESNGIDVV